VKKEEKAHIREEYIHMTNLRKRSIYLSWITLKIQTIVTNIKTKTPTR
jgi:hypothetical protein